MAAAATHWTAKARASFLRALATSGNVTVAAKAAGRSRSNAYVVRLHDAAFAAAWDDAMQEARDILEQEARRRAFEGVTEPVVSMGKLVRDTDGTPLVVRKYSDSLMQFLLKGAWPEKYRENVAVSGVVEHSIVPRGATRALADDLLAAVAHLPEARAALAARLLAEPEGGAA